MRGSYSLKAVLPAMVGFDPYADLEGIQGGALAQLVCYESLQPETTSSRRQQIAAQLRAYCYLDTWSSRRRGVRATGQGSAAVATSETQMILSDRSPSGSRGVPRPKLLTGCGEREGSRLRRKERVFGCSRAGSKQLGVSSAARAGQPCRAGPAVRGSAVHPPRRTLKHMPSYCD